MAMTTQPASTMPRYATTASTVIGMSIATASPAGPASSQCPSLQLLYRVVLKWKRLASAGTCRHPLRKDEASDIHVRALQATPVVVNC